MKTRPKDVDLPPPITPTYPSGKPWKKLCKGEALEARIRLVESWMRKGILVRSVLKKKIKKKWDLEWRMADIYISRARDRLLLHLNQTKEEHRANSLAFYEGVMMNPEANLTEKIRARERVDKLLGLEQPQQIQAEITARRAPLPVEELPLEERRRLLEVIRSKKNGESTHLLELGDSHERDCS